MTPLEGRQQLLRTVPSCVQGAQVLQLLRHFVLDGFQLGRLVCQFQDVHEGFVVAAGVSNLSEKRPCRSGRNIDLSLADNTHHPDDKLVNVVWVTQLIDEREQHTTGQHLLKDDTERFHTNCVNLWRLPLLNDRWRLRNLTGCS